MDENFTPEKLIIDTVKYYHKNKRAITAGGYCVYHDPHNNNKCAVGRFIKDDIWDRLQMLHDCNLSWDEGENATLLTNRGISNIEEMIKENHLFAYEVYIGIMPYCKDQKRIKDLIEQEINESQQEGWQHLGERSKNGSGEDIRKEGANLAVCVKNY